MSWRDQGLAFIIGGFPLLLGPVLRRLTVGLFFHQLLEGGRFKFNQYMTLDATALFHRDVLFGHFSCIKRCFLPFLFEMEAIFIT